eukprot:TRINITY_DN227_c0_g1_i1.p1 TRINITY_DN227_c0_g1~~TRINITY_DN227_c0_g1_i1.p1  ORF type:complete len:495 (+),score=211.05 TRINITY_DN227_c0_g1_i1:176-1660(+)
MEKADSYKVMTDHFEGIDKLVKEAPHTEGAPNFRRLPGFPVFGTGQPTMKGFRKCLEPIIKKYGDEKHIFWVNLRQEPVIYVNGLPFTARDPEKLNHHLEVKKADDVAKMEEIFADIVKKRGDEFTYFQDQYGEHPDERSVKNEEVKTKLESISTLTNIFVDLKNEVSKVDALRVPLNQDTSPDEDCFDQVVSLLKDTSASTPIVFNCQGGISRTTTAMVMAALMKEFQLATELNCMKGIVPDDILEALKKKKLGLPGIDTDAPKEKNALTMGEFEVIKELIQKYPDARIAKAQVDKLIDLAAPPPKGTGVQNIREIIIQDKMTFDVASDDWQLFLKNKIMNNIQRYFYLIVFALYIREVGPQQYPITFKDWMAKHEDLSVMIAEGRGNLEWERKIPDEKLSELKDLLASADFKKNMAKVIKRIYELAWDQFSDLPRGKHKNNSMHKLASKTMIEILPANLSAYVESKCGNLASTPDFYDVIGQVSWYDEGKAK